MRNLTRHQLFEVKSETGNTRARHRVLRRDDDNKYVANHTFIRHLTFTLLVWTIWWGPNNASKWRMVFNSAFKGLKNSLWNLNKIAKRAFRYVIYRPLPGVLYLQSDKVAGKKTVDFISFTPTKITVFNLPLFTEFTNAQQDHVQGSCKKILPKSYIKCGTYVHKFIYAPK